MGVIMQPSDTKAFQALLTGALAFFKQDTTDFTLSVWWEACQPFTLEQVRKAFTAHAMHPERGAFAPRPSDFVRELQGTFTDRALIAWGRVSRAMSDVGAYASVDFSDPAIHATVRELGGWATICHVPNDEQQFLQKRFCDFYRTYSTRGAPDAPLQLQGAHDVTNAGLSLTSPDAIKRLEAAPSNVKRIT
jgi:hypothetical protein